MPRKTQPIPVNPSGEESQGCISIERFSFEDFPELGEWQQPERHDRHSFFLLYTGSVTIEIDFAHYQIQSPAVVYMYRQKILESDKRLIVRKHLDVKLPAVLIVTIL